MQIWLCRATCPASDSFGRAIVLVNLILPLTIEPTAKVAEVKNGLREVGLDDNVIA